MILAHLPLLADWLTPQAGSQYASDVEGIWHLVLYVTGFFFCVVVGVMTFFVIRYRRRTPHDATSSVTHNTPLEIVWTGVPLALVLTFFYVGFKGFLSYDTPPSDCLVIDVEARQWQFTFTYPNGAQDSNLYLLKDQAVRLNMHSNDVLHALYLPTFRVQRNIVPGRQTTLWFIPTALTPRIVKTDIATGKTALVSDEGLPIYCTQYCGDGHSRMFSRMFVLEKADYEQKLKELANPFKMKLGDKNVFVPYARAVPEPPGTDPKDMALGHRLYLQLGCASCHSIDGSKGNAPTWKGLWKRDHEFSYVDPKSVDTDATGNFTLTAADPDAKWERYLDESVIVPDAKLVRFQGENYHGMPPFATQLSGSPTNDEKRRALFAFIRSLGTTGWKPEVTPEANPDLFDADHSKLVDDQGVPIHPESAAGIKAREKLAASQPAPATRPGN